jgi:predicted DCC family thiol-disulfide oxidoreductase YuxK
MSPTRAGSSGPILLYDGSCGFCARSVQFVLRHERSPVLRFAPLDSAAGMRARAALADPAKTDSMILLDGPVALVRSDAALRVASIMGGPWRIAALARALPRRLRDAVYDLVARHRHRLPGAPQCMLPPESEAARFMLGA